MGLRYRIGRALQLLGLIVTADALIFFFGRMGPLLQWATIGAGIFLLGYLLAKSR